MQALAHPATNANSGLISSSGLFNEILPEFSLRFRTYQDQLKFELLNMFVDMFSYFDDKVPRVIPRFSVISNCLFDFITRS